MSTLSIARAARDSNRTRSLALSQQARTRHVQPRPSSTKTSTSLRQTHSSTLSKTAAGAELKVQLDEVRAEGREVRGAVTSVESPAETQGDQQEGRPRTGPVEVSFADLAVAGRGSKHPSAEFEVVPRMTVIALDDNAFARVRDIGDSTAHPSSSSSEGEEGEDDWELLDLDEEDGGSKEMRKKVTRTWASIVSKA
ncbi:hypothetical protein P7C70_g1707, partial [Phenoliferia sp. Uapishka_3]